MVDALPHNLEGDRMNIFVLIALYFMQGIPLGLAGSIPLILQSTGTSYSDQALFSLVFWPFSLKLFWAPLVDSLFFHRFGLRKTWLVPVQYLLGILLLVLSTNADELLRPSFNPGNPSVVPKLTVVFFVLCFLAATQDIVVDGWALTMLHKNNVGYASTCNTVGQAAGYFTGQVVFITLSSADFCNKYFRTEPLPYGLITYKSFFALWGIMFIVVTTLVALLKKEECFLHSNQPALSIVQSYRLLYRIIKLPAVRSLVVLMLTVKIGTSAAESISGLKLIEAGIPKENLTLLAIPLVPVQIILPFLISRFSTGPKPLELYTKVYPYRLLCGLGFASLVHWAAYLQTGVHTSIPVYFYAVTLGIFTIHQVFTNCMFVSSMSFYAMRSDPMIGGTYMTLLNTINNLGDKWPSTLVLWTLDYITWKHCKTSTGQFTSSCDDVISRETCAADGGTCTITFDGYYIEVAVCVVIGFVWWSVCRWRLLSLQNRPESDWSLSTNSHKLH